MGIKDLFGKRSNKVVSKAQAEKLLDEVESSDLVLANKSKNNKLIPRIDYSKPENFAHYGSSEKYYEDSFNHILGSYPYDGSSAEKLSWRNEASGLDEYLLDTTYPSAVGHVCLNYSSETDSTYADAGGNFYRYSSPQYIVIKGGPNRDSSVPVGDKHELSKQFPAKGGRANIWDEGLFQESNLGINPTYGNTIEFWSKFEYDSWVTNGQAACLFDIWNGVDHGESNYVRMMLEVLPDSGDDFSLTYKYGNAAEGTIRAGVNLTADTKTTLGANWRTDWHHYAFSISQSASGIKIDFYIDGVYESTVTSGNQITSTIPQENYVANINALRTKPTVGSPSPLKDGDGSAPWFYLDEFRFWKSARTAKNIGRNWFTTVTGGTNTDTSKYHAETGDVTDLGVYYKFNEGVINTVEVDLADSQCLDYSGRISNGKIENYTLSVRHTTSAMDASSKVKEMEVTETPDPIMYPFHSDILTKKASLMLSGSMWDMQNNASFYHTMPNWILEEDGNGLVIKELVQTLSSYFDTLHHQIETLTSIRDNKYLTLEDTQNKPFFFAKQLLRSVGFDVTDIFNEATALEEIVSRGEQELFDARIQEVKNVIYQNIYNNITYIYKSKGTEKSFRNLIRCFGVDDELVKLNLYADGVDYTLDGRYSYTALKKNYVDFNNIDREEACVYSRDHLPLESGVRGYIGTDAGNGALTDNEVRHLSTTLTAEVIFPKQLDTSHPKYHDKDFTDISLFGIKEANFDGVHEKHDETGMTNPVRFRIEATKPSRDSLNAKFRLKCTDADGTTHTLESDEYKEVYDNTKWNFAVRLKPTGTPLADFPAHTATNNPTGYTLEFYGVQMSLDVVEREFTKSVNLTVAKGKGLIKPPKIAYCGHYRTKFEDKSTLPCMKTDIKMTDLMYWFDYLTDEEIKSHARDAGNSGRLHPHDDAYPFFTELSQPTKDDIRVPRKDTLALHWDFTNVTSSDSLSRFAVNDISQGGTDYISENRYGWFTKLIGYRHQGMGQFNGALPNDNQVINREYQYTAKHRQPEILAGDDMVEIRTQDDDVFTKDSRPINHFWAIEKSMNQVISDEMLNLFASIVEFNDLLGQPVHRYRLEYKSLQKFRSLFYERVENTPSFEKYVEFYKWLDSSMGMMMQQLIPASGNFSDSMRNMVESHILERNKYWTKFPTLEMKQDPPEGTIRGVRELTYDWEHGHAPVDRYNKKAILFDSLTDHVLIGHHNVFSFTDGAGNDEPFSISAWVYIEDVSSDNGPFVSKALVSGGGAGLEYLFKHEQGKLHMYLYTSPGTPNRVFLVTDDVVLTDQTWHQVVMTYSGNNSHSGIAFYVDGVRITAATGIETGTYAGMINEGTALIFGRTANTGAGLTPPRAFEDKLADIALFNKELSSSEVKELHNNGEVYNIKLHSASSSIISWYKMGDGDDHGGADGIKDYVGTRHGRVEGGATIVDEFKLPSVLDYDESEHCLWRAERAERTVVDATEDDNVDKDRETIRKAKVRDILGQNKMVPVGTDGFVEQGEPTLYDIATSKQYEGSTYATRRLSRPYKLNVTHVQTIKGGPNFADATLASPNDMLRAATQRTHKIQMTRLVDDAETCRDDYIILDGSSSEKRRAHVIRLTHSPYSGAPTITEMKGSLFAPPFYGEYPNDANATQRNITHDSYGQDHEVPMQGVFAAEWVGGNQHRHIDLNMERTHIVSGTPTVKLDDKHVRPELYVDNGGQLVHPFDAGTSTNPATYYMAARYTRDGLAKRPFNISNINTAVNKDNYTSYTGTPKLGNYTRDYEIVQTSGRSINNRWLVKNPAATPNVVSPSAVWGLYDYTLPVRNKDSANNDFGRTEHVFVERFSAPGSPAVLSRGALDYQAEEFSPYNNINYRNLRVRHHLNFWHKEHTAQFGYREDYIHGTESDSLGGNIYNGFGGNTAGVGAWHKNNRNPLTRMHLQQPNVESRRRYDNFYVGHQIPQSDWQYSWVTSSAVHFTDVVEYDDERRQAYGAGEPTQFPASGNKAHPRLSGYVSDFANATIGSSGSLNLLSSGSFGITHYNDAGVATSTPIDIDFVYGNYAVVDAVDWKNNTLGALCPECPSHRKIAELGSNQTVSTTHGSELNARLLNRNGPYQGASWKMLKGQENPIVRQQRRRNIITVQDAPAGVKEYRVVRPAKPGRVQMSINSIPSDSIIIELDSKWGFSAASEIKTNDIPANSVSNLATRISSTIEEMDRQYNSGASKVVALSSAGSTIVDVLSVEASDLVNDYILTLKIPTTDMVFSGGNMTASSAIIFSDPTAENNDPLATAANSVEITADGSISVIKVYFRAASDASETTHIYKDRRSDTHKKFIEPPTTWNMPISTVVSEKNDFVGTKVIHSYSNNLEAFANPKLTYRLGFVKENKQFHDTLLKKYTQATEPDGTSQLDFVSIRYKEYIFPKHRNVGLLKIRGRVKWDDLDAGYIRRTPTGDIRIFWRDNCFERIKGNHQAVNALGYPSLIGGGGNYLREGIGENHLKVRSFFAMDNFALTQPHGGVEKEFSVLGDLQYVGVTTYLSWIVNRNCSHVAGTGYGSAEWWKDALSLEPQFGMTFDEQAIGLVQAASQDKTQVAQASGTSDNANRVVAGPHVRGHIDSGGGGIAPSANFNASEHEAYTMAIAKALNVNVTKTINGKRIITNPRVLESLKGESSENASVDSIGKESQSGIVNVVKTLHNKSSRCQTPEPVVQLYYNPWSPSSYQETAWKYMTNQIAGKNPWYNKYVDFNIETRAMAQNYGMVAEFNISEHMDKYILDESGDFRAKNYNFLSLHGASYMTEAPHAGILPTEYSGKVTFPTEKLYSVDGTLESTVTALLHSDDMFTLWLVNGASLSNASLETISSIRERLLLQNNAVTLSEGIGTFNQPAIYDHYQYRNGIFAGGSMNISRSVVVGEFGSPIEAQSYWRGIPSWGEKGTDDTDTGRHMYFASGQELDDSEDSQYEQMVYREANSYSEWKQVSPTSRGAIAALEFNLESGDDDFLHGQIDRWDNRTVSVPMDTPVNRVTPFAPMKITTVTDTYRVPSRESDGQPAPASSPRKEYYHGQDGTTGTPITVSIWAKPEDTNPCGDEVRYNQAPVGLYVFGGYNSDKRPAEAHTISGKWREFVRQAYTSFGLFSNYPAPEQLKEAYPDGMGVTFFTGAGKVKTNVHNDNLNQNNSIIKGEDIYHFFRKSADGSSFTPATLPEGRFSHIILQILPPVDNGTDGLLLISPPKIKLIIQDGVNPSSTNVLYGIHRAALVNVNTDIKRALRTVPIGRAEAGHNYWTAGSASDKNYGPRTWTQLKQLFVKDYKLGKSTFKDVADFKAFSQAVEPQHYFKGQLTEFSMWAGILSEEDLVQWQYHPSNLLEMLLNGEILGGYTDDSKFQAEWGNAAPSLEIGAPYAIANTGNPLHASRIIQTNIDLEATRFTAKLPIWHRLGVQQIVNTLEKCEDWDDEFFNSYVHSDTVQFFDAIVEEHDAVSDSLRKRLRFRVNALKKLVPYRGFYPQDRTLQLANLFKEKMVDSIAGDTNSIIHHEQALQAALQPFFAPGILYNSIKAGVAVDWPAFTNETGLEPTYPNSEIELPYYNEDIHGIVDGAMHSNGPTVPAKSIVPNWYSPRDNPESALEGLLLDNELDLVEAEEGTWKDLHDAKMSELRAIQPKFFLNELGNIAAVMDRNRADLKAKAGYIILQEPNTRIPFEGLVALDSVLPSAANYEQEVASQVSLSSFKHVDLEISGWDAEGTEITLMQPEPTAGYNNPQNYPIGSEIKNNWNMKSVSVSIGDPRRELTEDTILTEVNVDWDVEVNFRRPPAGFTMPNMDQSGNPEGTDGAWAQGETPITINELNEEIAVKLCEEINRRQDIHYVAIPGYTPNYSYGDDTDDHVAHHFPVAYPEIFGINGDDFAPTLLTDATTDLIEPAWNVNAYADTFWQKSRTANLWSKGSSRKPPAVGRQHNGTWRIRLVYVGPPKLELDLNQVEMHDNIKWKIDQNAWDAEEEDFKLTKITKRPYDNIWFGLGADTVPYDAANPSHNNPDAADSHGFINGSQRTLAVPGSSDIETEPAVAPEAGWVKYVTPQNPDLGMGWKAMHLICPFTTRSETLGEYLTVPSSWMRLSSATPYSFFDGGGYPALEGAELALGDFCHISITRHLGTLKLSRWVDGWGWMGSAKYSVDTELGIRYVNSAGVTEKGNVNDREREQNFGFLMDGTALEDNFTFLMPKNSVKDGFEGNTQQGGVYEMWESDKPKQGPVQLYGGIDSSIIESVRVTPKPYQMYLMVPEYYMGHGPRADGGGENKEWAAHWKNYCYPYFEYLGSNGDPRFEMAMHNFLAEVPNFFLEDQTLVSFSSKPENQFKTMQAGKTYYMDVTMYQSDKFCTVASPHSAVGALGNPRHVAFTAASGNRLTMEGRYFGPAFRWKATSDYTADGPSIHQQLIRDPAQAPYVPPYMYGKAIARISFTASETKKYSLEEIFAGATVDNDSKEQYSKFQKCAEEDAGSTDKVIGVEGIINSPAYKARTTISASMNLFGKSTIKKVAYSAQIARLRDSLDESLQKYVPITATDPEGNDNDVWVIGTKFECPILNFYNEPSLSSISSPARRLANGQVSPAISPVSSQMLSANQSQISTILATASPTIDENGGTNASGTGVWAGYGTIPNSNEGVFVTVEETYKNRKDFSTPRGDDVGSLIDVCGFETQKRKVGEIAAEKEISEAVVMIPFVDTPSESTAETTVVDGRYFFKINKDLFNLQKANIENGKNAVGIQEWAGVEQDIPETSISMMIKNMKKYNIPPKFDFVSYPLKRSQHPFVMYIFEFNHTLSRRDLADIWQGLPPEISLTSQHDSSTFSHDLSAVDFFEENTLPKNVRWMTFKVKKKAKTNYFASTKASSDDTRFEFNFEMGKKESKYNYNWPYDFFTMLELIQVEAGVDILSNNAIASTTRRVQSEMYDEVHASETRRIIQQVKGQSSQEKQAQPIAGELTFGSSEDR